ncbi:MAG: hydrogenase formation protein HypD, partial [Oscillospiraceae bacterium]|nr:hydrogenase formation protein HypD [Oscillospiraceae bacterium]
MSLENFNPTEILSEISRMELPQLNLMEVCGTHTMAIAKSGLRSSLPENVKLLSGPGCPVCVTPSGVIDEILALAMRSDVIIATYGDMIKVPGSVHGKSLASVRALGARVEVVYSPLDAVALAEKNKGDEVVFLGAGFETTAPGTAAAIGAAKDGGITNFSVLSMLKTV